MADAFLHLPVQDRREALSVAADLAGDDGEVLPKTRSEEKCWSSELRKFAAGHSASFEAAS